MRTLTHEYHLTNKDYRFAEAMETFFKEEYDKNVTVLLDIWDGGFELNLCTEINHSDTFKGCYVIVGGGELSARLHELVVYAPGQPDFNVEFEDTDAIMNNLEFIAAVKAAVKMNLGW
jgi:hypothetical protein